MKKGVMELADAILINKADGGNRKRAETTRAEYDRILHYLRPATEGWVTRAYLTSAASGEGITEIWDVVERFAETMRASGVFAERRRQQTLSWVYSLVEDHLTQKFYKNPAVMRERPSVEKRVISGDISATDAANELILAFESSSTDEKQG
jgi:LAO/AO transport system kinase